MLAGLAHRQWLSLWGHVYLPIVMWWRKNVCLDEKSSEIILQEYGEKIGGER